MVYPAKDNSNTLVLPQIFLKMLQPLLYYLLAVEV
jgi:hypothetical protein